MPNLPIWLQHLPHLPLWAMYVLYGLGGLATLGGLALTVRWVLTRPNSYFTRWLSDEELALLRQAGVPFQEALALDGEPGVLFEARYLRRVKNALKAQVVSSEAWPKVTTRISEVILVRDNLQNEHKRFDVTLREKHPWYWRPRRSQLLRLVRKLVVPSAMSDVVVHVPSSDGQMPVIHDDKFHIFVCATPHNMGDVTLPETIWGLNTGKKVYAYAHSGRGVSLFDEKSGFFFGELIDNCLYLHTDILNAPRSIRYGLLARMLQKSQGELSADKAVNDALASLPADAFTGATQAAPAVVCDNVYGRRKAVLTALVGKLIAPMVAREVVVHDGQGRNCPPVNDGKFHIFLNSSPLGKPIATTPDKLWGAPLHSTPAFMPSGQGAPVMDESGDYCAAEVGVDNMFVHSAILHFGGKRDSSLLARLFVEARREMTRTAAQVDDDFADACLNQIRHYTGEVDAAYNDSRSKYVRANLTRQMKTASNAELELARLKAAPGDELGREFDELMAINKVLDVQVNDSGLVVHTDTLYCVDPRSGYTHEIGAFEIRIPLNGKPVSWHNKTRQVKTYNGKYFNAPHVNGKGYACLGNTQDLFPRLVRDRQFASVIELAITFVESVNTDDAWGRGISDFPVAKTRRGR